MKYNYKTYGIDIISDIKISEFIEIKDIEIQDNPVNIEYGEMPEKFNKMREDGIDMGFDNDEVWLHVDNIASYYITNGNKIIVNPYENANEILLRIFLMCSCLGFIMLQRQKVAIHGGVIIINGKAIIFTGDRGAGKSTLTTALRQRGYKFISDDIAATILNDGPYVMPGFPYQKLCDDAMETMGYDKENCESFEGDNKIKYLVPAYEDFINNPTKLFGICELTVGEVDKVSIEEIKGSEKLRKIIANVYRTEFFNNIGGIKPSYFKQCVEIAREINFYKITRPIKGFTIEDQILEVEKIVANSL